MRYNTLMRLPTVKRLQSFFTTYSLPLLLGSILLVYSFSLFNGFVSDDRAILTTTSSQTFVSIVSHTTVPLRALLYELIYNVFGSNAAAFRVPNILFHTANTLLVYALIRTAAPPALALLIAALFGLHPIHVESVAWISGGVYPQYTFFFLLSLLVYIRSRTKNRAWKVLSLFFFAFSLLSSEKAVSLFLLFWLYEYCFGSIRKRWKPLVLFTGLTIVYFVFLLTSGNIDKRAISIATDYARPVTVENPLVLLPAAMAGYIKLIVWPIRLSLFHSDITTSILSPVQRVALLVGLFVLALYGVKKYKPIFWYLSLFLVPLLPTLTPWRYSDMVAERYGYLATIGIVGLFVTGVNALMSFLIRKKNIHFRHALIAMTWGLILVALTVRTTVRIRDWHSEWSLWAATVQATPTNVNGHFNLGEEYWLRGDIMNARKEFEEVMSSVPLFADTYFDLAIIYAELNQSEQALTMYHQALERNPNLWQSHFNLTENYNDPIRLERALEHIKQKAQSVVDPQSRHKLLTDLEKELGKIH